MPVCPICGSPSWHTTQQMHVVCSDCGSAPFTDELLEAVSEALYDAYYDDSYNWQNIAANH